jgi:hypothetical protein
VIRADHADRGLNTRPLSPARGTSSQTPSPAQLLRRRTVLDNPTKSPRPTVRCHPAMLNDSTMRKNETAPIDRREAERTSVETEVVVTWHFQPGQPVRYRSLDLSDTGMRIASSTPLLEGMTGVLVSVLPEGRRLDRAVMVVWSRSDGRTSGGGHEAGLRFF